MSSGDRWAEKTTWKPTPHRDPIAGTPYHKHVAVRLSLLPDHEAAAHQMRSQRIHASAAAG